MEKNHVLRLVLKKTCTSVNPNLLFFYTHHFLGVYENHQADSLIPEAPGVVSI